MCLSQCETKRLFSVRKRTDASEANASANVQQATFALPRSSRILLAGFKNGDAKMNWDAIGAVGEIVGALAVVITLVYLAKQMGINTAAIVQSSTHSTLVGRAESLRFLASDGEISALWWKGAATPDELSQEEWQRYILLVGSTLRSIEIAFLDHDSGRMSPELWHAQHESVVFWARMPGFRRAFDAYSQTFHPKFRDHLASLIENERLKGGGA